MKISCVTISFNQSEFLERAIKSVISQAYDDIEFIIVDPGSTDGSRDIILKYKDHFKEIIFERDFGPADGLMKGFARATGDIYCYLNSDDVFMKGAFAKIAKAFAERPSADVIYGHALVIDHDDKFLRRVWSDRFSLRAAAFNSCILIQPSTFFRSEIFARVNGFSRSNRATWDSELVFKFALQDGEFFRINEFLSSYRIHPQSITGSGILGKRSKESTLELLSAARIEIDPRQFYILDFFYWIRRKLLNPRDTVERLRRGPIFMRGFKTPPFTARKRNLSMFIQVLILPLPWTIRRRLLSKLLGFEIEKSSKIGFSLLGSTSVHLGAGSRIGHLTMIKGLSFLRLSNNARIGGLNWISGFPAENNDFFASFTKRRPELHVGDHAAITSRHRIDCTDQVSIGDFSTVGGWGSQFLTHSIDVKTNVQSCYPIWIGKYCFVGTRVVVLPKTFLGDYNVLSAGSVLSGSFNENYSIIGGVPARKLKAVDCTAKYFSRTTGVVN